ncbi:MAG TPA: histidine kinase [Chitinophagaceae bacterium]|nr:histidine kinase [Chitinophagaceae bacterium]
MNTTKVILNPEKNFLVTKKAILKTPAMNYNPASAAIGSRLSRIYSYVVIPLIAVSIPNVAGLITNNLYEPWELVLSYVFFTATGFVIWNGNVRLMQYLRKNNVEVYETYLRVVVTYFLVNVLFSGIVSLGALYGWHWLSRESRLNSTSILLASLFVIITVLFVNNLFEIILLRKEMEYNRRRAKKMETAKVEAELEALKTQIDPHFIFNSLNTLSYLITREPQSARLFNDTLAKVYRYILGNKEKDLVLLKEELEFISNYFYLLKIRFSEAVNMIIEINDTSTDDFLIPPISLQTLVENAIKHNEFNEMHPLDIKVTVNSHYVVVRNPVKPKQQSTPSNKIGLNNLDNRYRLITRRSIVIENNHRFFTVKLPILKF